MAAEECIIPRAMGRLKIGVLGSGKGSNFRAILSEIQAGRLEAEPVLVMADVEDAGILALAREAGIPTHVIREPKFRTKLSPEVEADVVSRLREAGAELVVLAGYMRMVKAPLLEAFPRRAINIHPSLLPAFPGLEAWRQALEAGAEKTGCTVHFVDAGMDSGEIIEQAEVPVLPDDTAATLHARIQVEEHRLYPAVVARFASGELR
ncbi:MAG: phosphoribosylglycinamide formyltransferase [Terrimicrobiaceae bacterium]